MKQQLKLKQNRKTDYNSGFAKLAVRCSADTFVVNQTLVLRINSDSFRNGENRQLLVAAKRQTVSKPQINNKIFLFKP